MHKRHHSRENLRPERPVAPRKLFPCAASKIHRRTGAPLYIAQQRRLAPRTSGTRKGTGVCRSGIIIIGRQPFSLQSDVSIPQAINSAHLYRALNAKFICFCERLALSSCDSNFTPGVVRIMVRISVVCRFSSPLAA